MTESHTFNAEIGRVLDLMIHSLYTNKDVFLRELISNASDACEKLRYQSLSNQDLLQDGVKLQIVVEIDKDGSRLAVKDTGIGMNRADMIENLGTIAKSGTGEFMKNLTSANETGKIQDFIGQFGVGFYSAFMVADKVEVISRKAGEDGAFKWTSDGKTGYQIEECAKESQGTEIFLYLKDDLKEEYLDKFKIRHIIQSYSSHITTPIFLKHEDGLDETQLNKKTTLWLRDKKDISAEEYKEFFKSVAHIGGEPWMTLHNKIEGNVNYTNLLFIPNNKPFDLFHPDRQTRVKLYVKHVFITEQGINIIPKYLRFVYGVIDSPDLPLNISRETLQDSRLLTKITELVEKKILSELKTKMEKDFDSYREFWNNFGQVLKEGLCEPLTDREALLGLAMFKTTKSNGELVSLDTYLQRMQPGQEEIYYYISETDDVDANPQLEAFAKKDVEVVLLSDYVDNFWTTVVHDCKGRNFKSVNRSDIDLSKVNSEKSAESKEENDGQKEDNDTIVSVLKSALEGLVKDVKISTKLTDSPACLSVGEGEIDIKMEKFLLAQGQLKKASLKTLEINPSNKLIRKVCALLKDDATKDNGKEMAIGIFEIACIAQDESLLHPNKFARRMFGMLSDS